MRRLLLAAALALAACRPATEAVDPAKFKTGLYEGRMPVYDFSVAHYTYLSDGGDYQFYEFKQLEDRDSLVCWRQTRGRYRDDGDTIRFSGLEVRLRPIDLLASAGNPWSDWRARDSSASAKAALYLEYGRDFFVLTDFGTDSQGNHWSVDVRSAWLGPEKTPLPVTKE